MDSAHFPVAHWRDVSEVQPDGTTRLHIFRVDTGDFGKARALLPIDRPGGVKDHALAVGLVSDVIILGHQYHIARIEHIVFAITS